MALICEILNMLHLKNKGADQTVYLQSDQSFYAPAMIMAGALSVTPVRTYVTYFTYVCPDRHPHSNSNIFYQNFMKLGHIV